MKTDKNTPAGQSLLRNPNPFLRLWRCVVVISRVLFQVGPRRSSLCWRLELLVILIHYGIDEFPELSADLVVRPNIRLLLPDVYTQVVDVLSHIHDVVADLNQHE